MTIADELRKLQELHGSGALTDEEFAKAKAAILDGAPQATSSARQASPLFPIVACDWLTRSGLRVLQIVAVALLLGLTVFLGIALYIVQVQNNGRGAAPPKDVPVISYVAVAMLTVCASFAFILPGIQTRSALRRILAGKWVYPPQRPAPIPQHDTGGAKLWVVHQTTMIVGLALLEGPAFRGCIAYLMEAQPLALGVVGVAVFLMLCRFPTEQRVRTWLERQAAVLTEMRQREVQYGKP